MPSSISVDNAYAAYRKALQDLYAPQHEPSKRKIRGARRESPAEISQRSQAVLDQSRKFGDALVTAIETNDLDRRELAGWKLLAAAASDLSAASDLLEAQDVDSRAEPKRKARSAFEAVPELREVLEAPLDAGSVELTKTTRRALILPKDPEAAKEQLKKTIATFLDEIPDAAASMSKTAVGEVITSGLAKQVVSNVAQEVLEHLPDSASLVLRHAASTLAEAVRKIEAALGEGVTERVKEEVTSWLKDIMEKHDTATKLLDRLYETERIGEDAGACMASAPRNTLANRYNQATKTLEDLMARYSMTKKILEGVMKVLGFVKTPLLTAVPWGPIGVYGTYLGVLAYAIFSGGDYLDWYRFGERTWLDRVSGLRSTVHTSLEGEVQ